MWQIARLTQPFAKAFAVTVLVSAALPLNACAHPDAIEPSAAQPVPPISDPTATPASNPPTDAAPIPSPVVIPPLPVVSDGEAREEAAALVLKMRQQIKRFTTYTPEHRARFIALAQTEIQAAGTVIDRPQLIMIVDRNENVQRMDYVLALPDAPWVSLGGSPVSTGNTGRKYYYITPTGVFQNSADRLGYRAEGTKNKNGIMGIGAKGSRVWDLGWQTATKGWLPKHETGQIRLEIHATDPHFLEWRLGHPASEGCIRIPATMNHFMDHYGLIDVLYEQAASYDTRFRALLPKDREPVKIAGDLIVVVDSGPQTEPKIDPLADKRQIP
ncbi:L,D-transpeptidase [Gluconobacter wancherniae]|uniref:YkuD domain-containing protein n=1 Tax=Gluconobacter wancherniae NBRC 103581 TaxID=656744 RepID=A0A511B1Y6_9PROT|nr:L,D-transpeptidase [Gluconobacter wancherniae]MBF0854593.1 L,D-transpeptidase [Gluconobacter wancherniae]MBS1095404.1 L,D-transpeptidase [Gluconobacter wancherniae]GBD57681.1 hypothetical protein NBRC103581_02273 [Gluconobacter wancherniae NBRC 103581]GBR62312.1 hypothetical protein AA103581_0243 [Gluconobacter wancherniae NBRC 103581]GEK94460.1 hypothetical protein GWA01_22300 [Gluconobacter wancherniae NBRC 103581]